MYNDENALLNGLLKERYFKILDLLEARMGSDPSYMWRGILVQNLFYWKALNGGLEMVLS